MAKIGLKNFRYALLDETGGTATYDGAKTPAKAVSCSVEITNNSAVLYADDALAESDYTFQSGTVTMGIDDEDTATMAALLGHAINNGLMTRNANDVAPYVGIGRIVTKMVNNVRKFKVEFLYKVKFSEPNQDDTTKGENLEFTTSEITGTIAALANGEWSVTKVFDDEASAVAFLEGLMAVSGSAATVTYNVNGGSGTISAVSAYIGQSIILNDGSGITPPSNKVFAGWDTSSSATVADVTSPYVVTGNVTLYAVYAAAE